MTDAALIDFIARHWIDKGGTSGRFAYCQARILDRIRVLNNMPEEPAKPECDDCYKARRDKGEPTCRKHDARPQDQECPACGISPSEFCVCWAEPHPQEPHCPVHPERVPQEHAEHSLKTGCHPDCPEWPGRPMKSTKSTKK